MKRVSLFMLLQRIISMITGFFQTDNDNQAGTFVSRYKDSYHQKLNL